MKCNHCGAKNSLESKGTIVAESETVEWGDGRYEQEFQTIWEGYRCRVCSLPTFTEYGWSDLMDGPEDITERVIYPRGIDNGAVPKRVRLELEKAQKVIGIDPTFYALGVRRVMEATCIDKKAKGKTLEFQVDDLVEKDILPQVIADAAHQLRLFGNLGAHVKDVEVKQADIGMLTDLADAVVDHLYRGPAKVEAVRRSLEERTKAAKKAKKKV